MRIDVFSFNSIRNAKDLLIKYRDDIEYKTDLSVKQLTQIGYEYMMSIIKFDSGELASSISWEYDKAENKGVIKVGADYAIFVEFGTGIVGANSPHPEPESWNYDVNNHGENGWWYYDFKQDRFRWTKGQPASAFVYRALEFMRENSVNILSVNLTKRM